MWSNCHYSFIVKAFITSNKFLSQPKYLVLKSHRHSHFRSILTCRAKFCARHDVERMRNMINNIARNAMNIFDNLPHWILLLAPSPIDWIWPLQYLYRSSIHICMRKVLFLSSVQDLFFHFRPALIFYHGRYIKELTSFLLLGVSMTTESRPLNFNIFILWTQFNG